MTDYLSKTIDQLVDRIDALAVIRDRAEFDTSGDAADNFRVALADTLTDFVAALKLLGAGLAIGAAFAFGAHAWNDHRTPRMSYEESSAIKREMVAKIGGRGADYELDHIVPLCMAGSNDRSNLQLQLWPDARRKDADEARLCKAIDHGYPLEKARQEMRDWR